MAEAEPEGPLRRRRRRWPWIALGFLGLGAALRVAAPYGVARGIERAAREATGLPVTVGNVDLGLLRGVVAADDIVVGRPGGVPSAIPLLRVRRLVGELAFADLLAGGVRLRELAVEEPVLRLQRLADGSVEDPLPPRPAEEPEAAEEATAPGRRLAPPGRPPAGHGPRPRAGRPRPRGARLSASPSRSWSSRASPSPATISPSEGSASAVRGCASSGASCSPLPRRQPGGPGGRGGARATARAAGRGRPSLPARARRGRARRHLAPHRG